ncbi:hypothetical protein [Nitratiruptor tergarcus]|uniref:Uncharacterized protein n=1 Tax=Nitratiruptor tergarcus DSM 16512 TaxID=1069081 RepID=A0A1W1WV42_9BACT|nr:hypothetical protein [Nitratiruptor tergarcus]SMC10188.1 hypothetical protein SAMN05660197_2030 [Nitratiruptor tergarcus DSM 16512]
MKKLLKWIAYLLLFVLFFIIFTPKTRLYYGLEKALYPSQIIVSDEKIRETPVSLHIENGKLFFKDIEMGEFEHIAIYPDIFFNLLKIEHFQKNREISLLPNITLTNLTIFYTPFYPIKAWIKGKSSLGSIKGYVNLRQRRVQIDLFASKLPGQLQSLMKKIKEGQYRYEYSY